MMDQRILVCYCASPGTPEIVDHARAHIHLIDVLRLIADEKVGAHLTHGINEGERL